MVFPYNPYPLLNNPLSHSLFLKQITLSGILRSTEAINPITNSATAMLFFPGQLHTNIPF